MFDKNEKIRVAIIFNTYLFQIQLAFPFISLISVQYFSIATVFSKKYSQSKNIPKW